MTLRWIGVLTHGVLKKAKKGDYRVQDDFGGILLEYEPSQAELQFGQKVLSLLEVMPVYARIDIMYSENGEILLSEIELIEPELWFRKNYGSAMAIASALQKKLGDSAQDFR